MTQTTISKPLTIVSREVENTVTYYILSGDNVYVVALIDGAPCSCKTTNGSACPGYYWGKDCKHTKLAARTERERSTDLQQHLRDERMVYSCPGCGCPRKGADSWCYDCAN